MIDVSTLDPDALRLLEALPCGAAIVDADGRIVFCNAPALRLLHLTAATLPAEGLAAPAFAVAAGDGTLLGQAKDRLIEAVRSGRALKGELLLVLGADDKSSYVEILTTPLDRAAGTAGGALCVLGDVTERVRITQALRERNASFRHLFERHPHAMWVLDRESLRFLEVNDAMVHHYGYARPELLTMRVTDMEPEKDAPSIRDRLKGLPPGWHEQGVWRHQRKDGSLMDVSLVAHTLQFKSKRALLVVAHDVSMETKAREALHEVRDRLEMVVKSASIAVYTLDARGVFTLAEGRALEEIGLEPGDLVGRSASEIYGDAPELVARAADLAAGQSLQATLTIPPGLPGAGHVYEVRASPMHDGRGRFVGTSGIAIDVTERARAEEERALSLEREREARAEAEEAVRQRDLFLGIASHELRSPLTSLLLQVQALLERAHEGASVSDLRPPLLAAERHIKRLGKLVDALLDVARIDARHLDLEAEPMSLASAVRDVAARLEHEVARARCSLDLHLSEDVTGAWDRIRIEQVVTNLLENALGYGRGKPIAVTVSADDRSALLQVRDQGVGISPEDQLRVFRRFERAAREEKKGGLGLGLFIASQIVAAHGGAIAVESVPGDGATFTVTLPRYPPAGT